MNAFVLLLAVGGWLLAGILGVVTVLMRAQRDEAFRALRHTNAADQARREADAMSDAQLASAVGRMTRK